MGELKTNRTYGLLLYTGSVFSGPLTGVMQRSDATLGRGRAPPAGGRRGWLRERRADPAARGAGRIHRVGPEFAG